jgi:SAM-dependent methyltransferase
MATAAIEKSDHRLQAKASLGTRLRAWWEGVDPAALSHRNAAPRAEAERSTPAPAKPPVWATPRIQVLQSLWGDGFSYPGGAELSLWLAGPCTLSSTSMVAELGAGLGGVGRTLHRQFGCRTEGFERDPELARGGAGYSIAAGLGDAVTVAPFDPEDVQLGKGAYDCILSRETLFGVADKAGFFKAVDRGLKRHGHFLYTDFVRIGNDDSRGGSYRVWAEGEPFPAQPWSLTEHRAACGAQKFDLRLMEDITGVMRGYVVRALAELMEREESLRRTGPAEAAVIAAEVGLWTRRLAALHAGEIGLCRFHAVKLGLNLLGDW